MVAEILQFHEAGRTRAPFHMLAGLSVCQATQEGGHHLSMWRDGDVICTLPMCETVRQLHPQRLVVFVTAAIYRNLVVLSKSADLVYGSRAWAYPYTMPVNFKFFGFVTGIFNPQTTTERTTTSGAALHLVDDLAGSCGLTVTARQPRLFPSLGLIRNTQIAYNLGKEAVGNRLIIGINGGRTWPVRTWDAYNWQILINKIHSNYAAVILQFGLTKCDGIDELDKLSGVVSLNNRLKPEEIVALVAICDLVVAICSGPVHIAGAVGTPVIGLFGPTKPQFMLPVNSPGIGLSSDVPCLFCHHKSPLGHWRTGCPNDVRCMKQLDTQTVFDAVKSMLAQVKQREIVEPTVSCRVH